MWNSLLLGALRWSGIASLTGLEEKYKRAEDLVKQNEKYTTYVSWLQKEGKPGYEVRPRLSIENHAWFGDVIKIMVDFYTTQDPSWGCDEYWCTEHFEVNVKTGQSKRLDFGCIDLLNP